MRVCHSANRCASCHSTQHSDDAYTLLYFKNSAFGAWHAEPQIEDTYDRFAGN